jgi:hypothetical protein
MDYFVEEGFSAAMLGALNRCRLYLQVLTLADISLADGSCIIPDVFQGIPLQDRRSTLRWPCQQRPFNSAWDLWRSALRSLQPKNKLSQPLGEWLSTKLHQDWFWYKDCSLPALYFKHSSDRWAVYNGTQNPRPCTRSSASMLFDTKTSTTVPQLPNHALPVTVSLDRYTGFMSAIAGPALPCSSQEPNPTIQSVDSQLCKHAYFKSLYPLDGYPSSADVSSIVDAFHTGLSIVTRCLYDPQEVTHG